MVKLLLSAGPIFSNTSCRYRRKNVDLGELVLIPILDITVGLIRLPNCHNIVQFLTVCLASIHLMHLRALCSNVVSNVLICRSLVSSDICISCSMTRWSLVRWRSVTTLWVGHRSKFSSTSSMYLSIRLNSALSIKDILWEEHWLYMVVAWSAAIRKKSRFLWCGRSFATKCGLQDRTYSTYPLVAIWLLNKPCYCGRNPDAEWKGAFSPLLLVSNWLRSQRILEQIQCGLSIVVTYL